MAKRKTTPRAATQEPTCRVEFIFEELTMILKARDANDKRADDFQATGSLLCHRQDLREKCATALRTQSDVGAMLQLSLIRGLVEELTDEIHHLTEAEKEKHTKTRRDADLVEEQIVAMLYSVRDWLFGNLSASATEGRRLEDIVRTCGYYMGDDLNPHRILNDAVVSAA